MSLKRRALRVAAAVLLVALPGSAAVPEEPPAVRIHYLGHAAFVL